MNDRLHRSKFGEIQQWQIRMGIFTVTQLSYTFRPRRRRRAFQNKQEKFHHSLRALAIRENKIHAIDLLDPKLDGTPVYLDVEGLPDRDFYYLIGVRVGAGSSAVPYSFWADNKEEEKRIWNEFLDVLSAIRDPQLIHFGSYETVFLNRMSERYGGLRETSAAATAIERAVNLLSSVFAHIYFPTFSNGLKEIAGYLGFRCSGSPASGLEAIGIVVNHVTVLSTHAIAIGLLANTGALSQRMLSIRTSNSSCRRIALLPARDSCSAFPFPVTPPIDSRLR
jgi:predicted RecB family nuclease